VIEISVAAVLSVVGGARGTGRDIERPLERNEYSELKCRKCGERFVVKH
jgi:hypothetical protein